MSWTGGYTAPTSAAFGGTLGAPPQPAPPPAPPAPPAAAPGKVDPFFRPEDLITTNNFWSQWNTTFADLDHTLSDLQTNTAFQRAQLADQHKSNTSGINDDAAARGLSHSSIRDGNQAQEQTNFTRTDQNLQDNLNNMSSYVAGVKNNFQTQILPGFNSAMDLQAVNNAQGINDAAVPPPNASAPAAAPPAPAPTKTPGAVAQQQPGAVYIAPTAQHAAQLIGGMFGPYQAPRSTAWGG